jgi:dihydroorotase
MTPPLRSKADMMAVRQALSDGTIDAIASDHAPHTISEKDIEFDRAEFGVIGLETELSVCVTQLVLPGILDWPGLVEKMSLNPSRILRLDRGTLGEGAAADIVVVDPAETWVVGRQEFFSRSKNSPFIGRSLNGVVEYTIRNGRIAYRAG